MRSFFLIIIPFWMFCEGLPTAYAQACPADLNEPIYQARFCPDFLVKLHPSLKEVQWPKPDTVEEALNQAEIDRIMMSNEAYKQDLAMAAEGKQWMKWGLGVLLFGIVLGCFLSQYKVEEFGLGIAVLGGGLMIWGAGTAKMGEHMEIAAWSLIGLAVVLGVWVALRGENFKTIVKRLKDQKKPRP